MIFQGPQRTARVLLSQIFHLRISQLCQRDWPDVPHGQVRIPTYLIGYTAPILMGRISNYLYLFEM
jgi:hypothetical protein